jgi:hypothetical protein
LHVRKSRFYISLLCSIVFSMVFVAILLRVVPACSLATYSIFKVNCERDEVADLRSPDLTTSQLLRRINQLEKLILNEECSYVSLDVPEVIADKLPMAELEILTESEVEAWNDKEISGFSGCWEFTGSAQSFVEVGCTGNCPATESSDATYCFDEDGRGEVKTEILGKYCRADIVAEFGPSQGGPQTLNFKELSDQKCPTGTLGSDGTSFGNIVARDYECKLSDQKSVKCSTKSTQGSENEISLVRKNDE